MFFPGQNVSAEYEIIGIVRDTRYVDLRKPAEPMAYVPIQQAIGPLPGILVAIRTKDTAGLLPIVRRRLREIVPGIPYQRRDRAATGG